MTDVLTEIGTNFGTDKATWHGYTKYYHELLKDFRPRDLFFLELGFGGYEWPDTGGESIRMWHEYAYKWDIAVLDIHPKNEDLLPLGATFYQGSQDDPDLMNKIINEHGRPTIVIDDASHIANLTLASFDLLWPELLPGGWYIIEDIGTSYFPGYNGHHFGNGTPIEFSKGVIDNIMANSRYGRDQGILPNTMDVGIDIMTVMPNAIGLRKK
jgi:cephalosporin hydroxylase